MQTDLGMLWNYRVQPNYHTYPYKCTVKQFCSLQLQPVYYIYFFIKAYVVCTHLNCIVDAIQMGIHNICFYKENQKKKKPHKNITLASLDKSLADLFFFKKCSLSLDRCIFYHKFSQ